MSARSEESAVERLRKQAERAIAAAQGRRTVEPLLERIVSLAADGSEASVFAHRHLAEYRIEDHPWRALLHLRKVVGAHPDDDVVHALMGLSHALLANFRAAVSAYRRALAIAQRNPWYHHNLGHLLDVALDQPASALRHLEFAHRAAHPPEHEIAASLAHCLARLGRLDEARDLASTAVAAEPRNREHKQLLAWIERGAPQESGDPRTKRTPTDARGSGAGGASRTAAARAPGSPASDGAGSGGSGPGTSGSSAGRPAGSSPGRSAARTSAARPSAARSTPGRPTPVRSTPGRSTPGRAHDPSADAPRAGAEDTRPGTDVTEPRTTSRAGSPRPIARHTPPGRATPAPEAPSIQHSRGAQARTVAARQDARDDARREDARRTVRGQSERRAGIAPDRARGEARGGVEPSARPRTGSDSVLPLLERVMREGGFTPEHVSRARRLWRDYREVRDSRDERAQRAPKPDVCAAAIEYAIARLHGLDGVTRASVARRYGVGARSVSERFDDIQVVLALEPDDPRYARC